ncbi:MAG: hypothetical protein ABI954_03835 [Pyrinomonadaceae bacterium]
MDETLATKQMLENDIETARGILAYSIILHQSELGEKPVHAYNSTGELLIKYRFDNNKIIPVMLERGLIEELDELSDIAFRAKTAVDSGDNGKFYRARQTPLAA